MVNETKWLKRIQTLSLPAVLPVKSLPQANADLSDWIEIIREDPLLTIHLFRYANKMLASHDVSVKTLDHAVNLLGSTRLIALTGKVPRIEATNTSTKGLLNAIGDSLLAASLMRQWFEIRQIPWTEADYWVTLFYDLSIWVAWLLEPETMEGIEYQVQQGANRTKLIEKFYGMPLRDWNDKLCKLFQLPILVESEETSTQTDQRTQNFKQSALKFFLPFSHDLASTVRSTTWTGEPLQTLCRTGEVSLGLTHFQPMLKQWVANAAREYSLPQVALAARRLLAHQPPMQVAARVTSGFSEDDVNKALKLSRKPEAAPIVTSWPEAEEIETLKRTREKTPKPALERTNSTGPESDLTPRKVLDLNAQREIRRQFRNQKSWHSPVEVQESALFGLINGFAFKRVTVLEITDGFLQVFDSEGCQQSPLLRNLKMPIASSELLKEFTKKVSALWVNSSNKANASRKLPPTLLAAAEDESFFLRSFSIGGEVTMLLYADLKGSREPLNAYDYKLFREYCADWNTALNRLSQ
ncbi:HDOD domain-containing protein [Reinekea forsetii]|nr:HDOD domain-containing protein [Reinekea forsetii]